MKIDKVIFSTSEEYSGFWNIQSKIFKSTLGIDPVCLLFGKKSNTDMNEEFGKVIEMEFIEDLPKILQITWSKFYYPQTEPETTWLMGDIDMIPLTKRYFQNDNLKGIDENTTYVHMNIGGCARGLDLSPETWLEKGSTTMGGCDLPAHYHVAKGHIFGRVYGNESFEQQVRKISNSQKYGVGARCNWDWQQVEEKYFWIAEENYSSEKLWEKYSDGVVDFVGFYYDTRNNANRVDRDSWDHQTNDYVYDLQKLRSGGFVDVHCMRSHGKGFETQSWWGKNKGFDLTRNSFKDFEKQNMKLILESGMLK